MEISTFCYFNGLSQVIRSDFFIFTYVLLLFLVYTYLQYIFYLFLSITFVILYEYYVMILYTWINLNWIELNWINKLKLLKFYRRQVPRFASTWLRAWNGNFICCMSQETFYFSYCKDNNSIIKLHIGTAHSYRCINTF